MALIDDLQTDACYVLLGPFGAFIIPSTLAMTGGGRGPPSQTIERSPGSSVPYALGDGIRPLLPVTFKGPLRFDTEVEKDLFVAAADRAAEGGTYMQRYEKSGPLGAAKGWARWDYKDHVTIGYLTIELYPTARPTVGGIEVDW
ncbi:hypothetical protein [Deinococcus humi]|uniref:Uncharacterized protein n=1 Tax=Deinococcus humi TaxID=662880 RepID=A0A7W8NBP2_9DEIO|nr:hypothetical protein [Deinococcus humi]MBB5361319.1 hypothetical protein [Deinococcus humi]GGO19463.1 hypothetical protein GCM10008949_03840 [Deinococcus humi]